MDLTFPMNYVPAFFLFSVSRDIKNKLQWLFFDSPCITKLMSVQVILEGAKEHSLPSSYLEKLQRIENNGKVGDGSVAVVLGRF